ncbi:hypothetical protein C5167_019660 [Papaver somniferum]|uniref:Probable 6-phosphogluconolactonase n=1 Tax=Papaver somniferum TaxID=3469 RepID=A0A4Y7IRA9_PAPSO|nr:probable 6-phosphogluconolactonase 4, chloroplastic [Papaver somniferum]RZC51227.1 hypothetical protein C5167_019660 [Papaver somniferum]
MGSSSLATNLRTFSIQHQSSSNLSFSSSIQRLIPIRIISSFLRSNKVNLISTSSSRIQRPAKWKLQSSMAGTVKSSKEHHKKEIFENEELLSISLAKYIADLSEKFVKERGSFTVTLSGGSLIKSLRKLAEAPYVDSIDWAKWHVLWLDERVVPKDHADSNYKLAYDGLLSKVPIPPGQVYAINDALSAEGAADDYETCLKHLVNTGILAVSAASGFPKFDLQLLGMGPDGHVASLFPGHPLLYEKERWVTFIKDSPKPPPERITLTFPVINSSAYNAIVLVGAGKSAIVAKAWGKDKSSDLLPVEMVTAEDEFTWFMDKEAASKL